MKSLRFWAAVIWMLIAIILIWGISAITANAGQSIERAHINAPGQLVVDYWMGPGSVSETRTIVLSVKEPHFCDIPNDPNRKWFFFEALLVEREPIKRDFRTCGEAIERDCDHAQPKRN